MGPEIRARARDIPWLGLVLEYSRARDILGLGIFLGLGYSRARGILGLGIF